MIRLATTDDSAAILEIYRPSIETSSISFEIAVPSTEEMHQRIESGLERFPWIVDEDRDRLRGYAYASSHHPRAAYRWTANVSVYVRRDSLREGVASRLYRVLFAILQQQGMRKVIAGITVPNPASRQLHESLGFELAGEFPDVGYKLGSWLSVGWWHRSLGAGATSEPAEPLSFRSMATDWQGDLVRCVTRAK